MPLRIGLVVPHIFMQADILPDVIFSPGQLALWLADELQEQAVEVTLFTPGSVTTAARNVVADLSGFRAELDQRGDTFLSLLKKHPLTFITLGRQVQSELIAKAYSMANNNELDVIHIYSNEEDTAVQFAGLCTKPVVFTHHDPFNFLVQYRSLFPRFKQLPWISMSLAQRNSMPAGTNWLANIYHGLPQNLYQYADGGDYYAYFGRIIESKGLHLAIKALKTHNKRNPKNPMKLRIAGKHYAGNKNSYWEDQIAPHIDNESIFYDGYISDIADKQRFLGNAKALIVPSTFEEPFGLVSIEALACGTPVIGLSNGATPEIIKNNLNGFITDDKNFFTVPIDTIDRKACRQSFDANFTLTMMAQNHIAAYKKALQDN